MGPSNTAHMKVEISAVDKASKVLLNFGKNATGAGNAVGKAGALAAKGLAIAGASAVAFGVLSVKAYSESQDSLAQLNAVLKSTHGVAGVTADAATKLSHNLQEVTKFSDETVNSAESMLLTFTKVGKDIFPQATETVLNMSQALGQDTKSSAIQLGKALQDPIRGVLALRRVGVSFSTDQQAVIKRLVETGKSAQAQKLILKELQTEFGGSARAAGKTFSGQLAILKNNINDVQESIGLTIVTAITPFFKKLADTVSTKQFQNSMQEVTKVIILFFNAIFKVIGVLFTLFEWLNKHRIILAAIAGVIGTVLIAAFVAWAIAAASAAAATIAATWPILAIGAAIGVLAFLVVKHWTTIKNAFAAGLNWIKKNWVVVSILAGPIGVAVELILHNFNKIKLGLSVLVGWFKAIVGPITSTFKGIATAIVSYYRWSFNLIAAAWNATIGKLSIHTPSWLPIFGNRTWSAPQIPALAEGGIVTKPTIAMIGEAGPEAVVPLNKGTMAPIHITIQAGAFMGTQLEARKFAKYIMTAYNDLQSAKNMRPA